MKVLAINGSPRKEWNTVEILSAALEKARQQGAEAELIHLDSLKFTGCKSCFACKRIGSASFGRCALQDDLKAVLDSILSADVALFGTPIYFSDVTAGIRALFERLWFPSLNYNKERTVNYPRNVVCGLVYTMNVADPKLYESLYQQHTSIMELLVGPTERFIVTDTMQFDDYSKYLSTMFDAAQKKRRHEEIFPQQKAEAAEWFSGLMEKKRKMEED